MKIVHVITRLVRGGAQKVTVSLVRDQVRRGGDVWVVYGRDDRAEGSLEEEASAAGANLVEVPRLRRSEAPLDDVLAVRELYRHFQNIGPDVVHTHTSKAGVLGRLSARFAGVPAIVHTPHGCIFASNGKIPGVSDRPVMKKLFYWLERISEPFADRLVAISESERREFQQRNIGYRRGFPVIPDGIFMSRSRSFGGGGKGDASETPKLGTESFRVGSMGRLSREKGHDVLVNAVADLDGDVVSELLLMGSGPRREELRSQVQTAGMVDRVRFTGFIEQPDRWLPALDCYVQPSRYEGFGLAVVEAMSHGIPVIVSDTGGLSELIEDGRSGLLVEPDSPEALREAIRRLRNNDELAIKLGQEGQRRARSRFSARQMGGSYWALYQRLLSEREEGGEQNRPDAE